MKDVYASDDIVVKYLDHPAQDEIWISFGAADGLAFGEAYFNKIGKPALLFVTKLNHWYQYSDIWDALDEAKEHLAGWRGRIICYGSSMGGFAALAFSKYLAATHIVVAAPQISIDPKIVGHFDNRWTDIGARLHFQMSDARTGLSDTAELTIIADPMHREDNEHVRLICAARPARVLRFPNSGHGCLHTLNNVGVLQDLLAHVNESDRVLNEAFRSATAVFKKNAVNSPHYYIAVAEYYFSRGRFMQGSRWIQKAIQMSPGWLPLLQLIEHYFNIRRNEGADRPEDHLRLIELLCLGHWTVEATSALERAHALFPADDGFRSMLALKGAIATSHESRLRSERETVDELRSALQVARDEIALVTEQRDFLHSWLQRLKNSLSWKVTRPLRGIGRAMRSIVPRS